MVGPRTSVWKVLRETEGERFLASIKVSFFQANLRVAKMQFNARSVFQSIKILLHAIKYPLAIELFALQNFHCATTQ